MNVLRCRMNRMDSDKFDAGLNRKLDQVFAEYRAAFPDPDASAAFMPGLWQRIESRRSANMTVFRRLAQVCKIDGLNHDA